MPGKVPTKEEETEIAARQLFESMAYARRRPRPRVAEPFRTKDAIDKLVDTAGGGVQAWRIGEGPAVLLVHGWEDDNSLWAPMIEEFQRFGRACVAFDLPGHGFSPAETVSVQQAGAAILDVVREMGPIESIVAHSFGSPSSMHALVNGLQIDRITMIAPPMHRKPKPNPDGSMPAPQGGPGRRPGYNTAPPEVMARAMELYKEKMGGPREQFDMESAAPNMTIPALLIHSLDDETTSPAGSRALAELWPGAKLELVDGHGHRFVCQDDEVIRTVVNFTEGIPS
jgi:pimeloyl-ACP methyl ester carboxylesterase